MFKKTEKKLKVVFKLHFATTQVPPLKKPALTVALIPEDVGKPTVKLQKAQVKDGTCSWEHPVYETMKLVKMLKTGLLKEKIYHFVVQAGSSKSGFLGEASIDFSEFAAAIEPMTISLPLKFANSGAVLHVTIQRIPEAMDPRDNDELSNLGTDESNHYYAEDAQCQDTISSSTSASDWNINREHNSKDDFEEKKVVEQNGAVNAIPRRNNGHQRSKTEWSVDDSTNSSEDSLPREPSQSYSQAYIEKLRDEISKLMRQADVSEIEIQSLRKQATKETKRGDNLMAQITCLKEERDALRMECQQLRASNNSNKDSEVVEQLKIELDDLRTLLEETREELAHEMEVSTESRLQMQKTQELNNNLVLAVKDLEETLEQKNRDISDLSDMLETANNTQAHDDEEVNALQQKIEELCAEIDVYRKQRDEDDLHIEKLTLDYEDLKQEKHDITLQLEKHQLQHKKIETSSNNHLITIRELELEVRRLEEENRAQALEVSESLASVNELKFQVKELQMEIEKQGQYKEELDAATRAKQELEQRASRAEEALRMARYRNTKTSERHEEEFRKLSLEMASKIDENEKQAMKAVEEANELRAEKKILEEALQKANEELRLVKTESEQELQELSDRMLRAKAEERTKVSDELEKLRTSMREIELQKQRCLEERDDFKERFVSARKVADKAEEELTNMRCIKVEKERMIANLHSEVEHLRTQLDKLNRSLTQEKAEKEKLVKRVGQLEDDLVRKEEEVTRLDRRLKTASNKTRTSEANMSSRDTNSRTKSRNSEEVLHLKEKLKSLEERMSAKEAELRAARSSYVEKEKTSVKKIEELESSMKQKEKSMEREMKDLQDRYSEISLKFAEVEGERQQLVMTVRNLKNGKK